MSNINPQLTSYIEQQKQLAAKKSADATKKAQQAADENKKRQLIDAGLFTMVFDPEEKDVKSDEYPFLHYDTTTKKCVAYQKVPIELTDEEYQEFLKYYKPSAKFVSEEKAKAAKKIDEKTSHSALFGLSLIILIASIVCTCFGLFFMIAGVTVSVVIMAYCALSDKISKLNAKLNSIDKNSSKNK